MQKLKEIREEDPSAKSLVFSHFQSSIEWLQTRLGDGGSQYRTLNGSMSRTQRTAALSEFQHNPNTTVFLMSIRAAACGINLTQANHVFVSARSPAAPHVRDVRRSSPH